LAKSQDDEELPFLPDWTVNKKEEDEWRKETRRGDL